MNRKPTNRQPGSFMEEMDSQIHLVTWLLAAPLALIAGFLGFFAPIVPVAAGILLMLGGICCVFRPGRHRVFLRLPVGRLDGIFWVSVGGILAKVFWGMHGVLL